MAVRHLTAMDDQEILIFDTSPLIHFSREGWLGPLKAVVGARSAVIPDVVAAELQAAAVKDGRVAAALDQEWLVNRPLQSADEIRSFAEFSELLVRNDRNRGEAAVLALASCVGGRAVLDDLAGRKAAARHGIRLCGTLALMCEAIRDGLLTVRLVSALADDLLSGAYRLPFGPGGFEKWVAENGLLA
jgi:predicted nucleic acid-binding protein